MKLLIYGLLILMPAVSSLAQRNLEKKLSGEYNPSELVSIDKSVSFDEAVEILNSVSQYVTGKSIVSTVADKSPIGIDIYRLPYTTALNIIVNMMNLEYAEEETRIVIKRKAAAKQEEKKLTDDIYADTDAREISISAVFFQADVERSRERGIDYKNILSNGKANGSLDLRTKSVVPEIIGNRQVTPAAFEASGGKTYVLGDFKGNVTALFRFFETENLGEIITSPSITVRDRQKGRIQVGSDFSIKQRDFSGNIIERFYSAGSIIEVVPYVYKKGDLLYTLLKINVERSTFFPSELTTEVKKTSAATDVLLLNGEETVIGGLFVNEDAVVRNGIPFLKDLPWWVLGIRYLTGSDQTVIRKKEVIILLKAEIIPTLEERFSSFGTDKTDKLKEQLKENEENMKKRDQNYIEKKF